MGTENVISSWFMMAVHFDLNTQWVAQIIFREAFVIIKIFHCKSQENRGVLFVQFEFSFKRQPPSVRLRFYSSQISTPEYGYGHHT